MPIFDPASLHAAIDHSLQAADVGAARNAFVLVATTTGIKAVLSTKIGEHWTIASLIALEQDADLSAGLEIKATW